MLRPALWLLLDTWAKFNDDESGAVEHSSLSVVDNFDEEPDRCPVFFFISGKYDVDILLLDCANEKTR